MAFSKLIGSFSMTTANVAGTEVCTTTLVGCSKFDRLMIVADLVCITGGTLDVYLQREIATNVWTDWLHFQQLAAAAAAINYAYAGDATLIVPVATGLGTTAAPGVALPAGHCVGGHPGDKLRAVFVSGAGASAGAAQSIYVSGWCAK